MDLENSELVVDRKRWIRHTYMEWQSIFPFWSVFMIKGALASLEKKNLFLIEQHGKQQYDRTNWYAFANNTVAELLESESPAELESTEQTPDVHAQERYSLVIKRMKGLKFFPLKKQQQDELLEASQAYPLEMIIQVLEITTDKCLYAWKYAYKVLITSVTVRIAKRKISERVCSRMGGNRGS